MKWKIFYASLLLSVALFSCKKDDEGDPIPVDPNPPIAYNADLKGSNEVPPNQSAATGYANMWLNQYTKILYGSIHFSGLNYSAGHIHSGAPGVSGPPVFPFTEQPNNGEIQFSSATALDSAQIAALDSGLLYVNLHSPTYPNGEIRGQLIRQGTK